MSKTFPAALIAAALAAGCGDVVVEGSGGDGGAGGTSSTGGTITTSSTTTVPGECAVPAEDGGPYPVTIRFVNPADSPVGASVYLRQDCLLNYEVRACADGYTDALALSGICTSDCAQANECIQCGACLEEGIEIQPGGSFETSWDGTFVTFDQNAAGCSCHVDHVAPAQKYRIGVPVFPSADAAIMNMPDFQTFTLFDLPSPTGVVEVELYPPPP
jgi:hypothetical protein